MSQKKIYIAIKYRFISENMGEELERRYFSSRKRAHLWFKRLKLEKGADGDWRSGANVHPYNCMTGVVYKAVVDKKS